MSRRRTTALAAVGVGVVLATTACSVEIGSSGETVTETFDITRFSELDIDSAFDVTIEVGPEPSLEIDVGEGMVDNLEVEQDGERLRIGLDNGLFSTSRALEIRLTTPGLTKMSLEGAVDAEITGLDGGPLEVELSGASQITGEGSVGVLIIDADGASDADFSDTSVDRAEVEASGASHIDVNGADEVEGMASGASSVDVSPTATMVNVTTSGAASVD